jgi:hypothetical protein
MAPCGTTHEVTCILPIFFSKNGIVIYIRVYVDIYGHHTHPNDIYTFKFKQYLDINGYLYFIANNKNSLIIDLKVYIVRKKLHLDQQVFLKFQSAEY